MEKVIKDGALCADCVFARRVAALLDRQLAQALEKYDEDQYNRWSVALFEAGVLHGASDSISPEAAGKSINKYITSQLAQARAEEREHCISVIQETAGLALRIRSAYGYLLAQSALTSDTTFKDIATKEFSDHRDEFRRLGELLGVQNP